MKPTIWILGGHGLIGEALKKVIHHQDMLFKVPTRAEFELGRSDHLVLSKNDFIIDLIPSPAPRIFPGLSYEEYHLRFIKPHLEFIQRSVRAGIKKYIYVSSGGSIYGRTDNQTPLTEKDILNPVSYYGMAKKLEEETLIYQSLANKSAFLILRPSNVFNSDTRSLRQTGLIGILKTKFENKEPIDLLGPVSIAKDYIANSDVAEAILSAIRSEHSGIYNIGSGRTYTIGEIVSAFEKSFQFVAIKNQRPMLDNDVPWFCLDTKKAHSELNFKAQVDVIHWIESNTNPQS